jgi:hypothetical protein
MYPRESGPCALKWRRVNMPHVLRRLLFATVLAVATPAAADIRTPTKPAPPSAITISVEYQRVGRALLALQDQRGRFDIDDLLPRVRAIKLDRAVATRASRAEAAAKLAEIAAKIERLRGITIAAACLDNPLADGCSYPTGR